jgi:7,8-dihydropterin-6-yl-methyl-4-(beta-D-ribofuranosyl)aminobenzene 5'-phosphate synthase
METIIPDTVEGLRTFGIKHIITGHCTGWRTLHALANAFGEAVSQSAVGTSYTFATGEPHSRGGVWTRR